MFTAEPSYFDFLMKHRCERRIRVPFAQAVGVMADCAGVARCCRSRQVRAPSLGKAGHDTMRRC